MNNHEYAQIVLQELAIVQKDIDLSETTAFLDAICAGNTLFVCGMGRSGYIARGFCMRLMHLGLKAAMVGDTQTTAIKEGDVLIVCSGSGETKSLISTAEKAQELKAQVVLLTINPQSTIGKIATRTVRINAPSPKATKEGALKSIQPMANLFEQSLMIYLDICIMLLMERLNETSESMFKRHANLE